MVIENSTLDNIRIRAVSFIYLQGTANLTISQTNITRMDFNYAFFHGIAQNVRLSGLSVTGLNRDHSYVRGYPGDAPLVVLHQVDSFTLEHSLLQDNLLLADPNMMPQPTVYLKAFRLSIISSCIFRRDMNALWFQHFLLTEVPPTVLISQCVFEDNFMCGGEVLYFGGSMYVTISECSFKYNVANYDMFLHTNFLGKSSLQLSHCEFINNQAFLQLSHYLYPTDCLLLGLSKANNLTIDNCLLQDSDWDYKRPHLVAQWVQEGLLLNSSALFEDYLHYPPQQYSSLVDIYDWRQVHIVNLSAEHCVNFAYGLSLEPLISGAGVAVLDHLTVKDVNCVQYLNIFTEKSEPFTVYLKSSSFLNISGVTIFLQGDGTIDTPLIISDSCFESSSLIDQSSVQVIGASVQVFNSQFYATSGLSHTLIAGSTLRQLVLVNCSFHNNSHTQTAADLTVVSQSYWPALNLTITHSEFEAFSGTLGGSVYLGKVQLQQGLVWNCSFLGGSTAPHTGVLVTTHAQGLLTLEQVLFSGYHQPECYLVQINTPSTTAKEKLTRLVSVVVRDCSFLAAVKLEGQLWPSFAETVHCSFLGNQGIVVWSNVGVLTDTHSLFQNNTAEGNPCYFQDQQSTVLFQHTQFLHNSASQGGCLYLRGRTSSAVFNSCVFTGNTAVTAGVMRVEQFVSVEMHDSVFTSNTALQGSALYLLNVAVPLQLFNTSFTGHQGEGVIYLVNSQLTLVNVAVVQSTGGLVLQSSEVRATRSLFAELTGQQGCVVSAVSSSVTLEACEVLSTECSGNLLDLPRDSSLLLSSCVMQSLSSDFCILSVQSGRDFQAVRLTVAGITASTFLCATKTNVTVQASVLREIRGLVFDSSDSSVLVVGNSSLSDVNASGVGFLSCSGVQYVELQNVRVTEVRASVGAFLSAKEVRIQGCWFSTVQGGQYGVLWVQDSLLHLSTSSFHSNTAVQVYSMGGALSLINSPATVTNCSFTANSAYSGGAIYWTVGPLAQLGNFFQHNWAYYGPSLASDTQRLHVFNSSSLLFASGQLFTGPLLVGLLDKNNQLVRVESSKHWLNSPSLSGSLAATAQRGLLSFSQFSVESPPGLPVSVLLDTQNFTLHLRNCIEGEVLGANLCTTCSYLTYSVDLTICSKCPSGGDCPGDGNLYPQQGYWRPSETFDGVLACANQEACRGHANYTSQTGLCAEPYEGNLCQQCKSGTSRKGPDKCASCASPEVNSLLLTVSGLGTVGIVAILTRSALKSAEHESSPAGTVLKVLLNYAQMTTLAARFPLSWPTEMETFFAVHEYAGNSGEQYMSLDCVLSNPYFTKVVLVALLPPAVLLLNAVVWGSIWLAFRQFSRPIRVREMSLCSTIVSLFYVHPIITRTSLLAFQCMTLLPGEQWLRVELSIRCWTGQHAFLTLAAALPAAVLWGVGIPSLALLVLVKYRKQLRESNVRVIVGFMCANYQTHYYFWEILLIYKKLGVIMLLAFLSGLSAAAQGLALVLVLTVSALLQLNHIPFKRISLNRCQLFSEVTVLLTAYAGLNYTTSFLPTVGLLALILLLNIAFVLYIVKVLLQAPMRRIITRLRGRSTLGGHSLRPSTKARNWARLQEQMQLL